MSGHDEHADIRPRGILGVIDGFVVALGSVFGILTAVGVIAFLLIMAESWPWWGAWLAPQGSGAASSTAALDAGGFAVRDVEVGGATIHALLADTPTLRERGLGGRDALAPDGGMLFVFDTDGTYGIWMKDMRFPIDIVWLSGGGRVMYLRERITPDTYPKAFIPPEAARYVLELPAGFAAVHGIAVGTMVDLPHAN